MSEVTSYLKSDTYGLCGCGCGREGRKRKKPWDSGVWCVRNCDRDACRSCRGSAANSSGRTKQAKVRQRVGATGKFHGAGHEEQTVQRLIRDDRYWPSPARFNETRRAIERGQVEPVKALPWGPRNDTDRQNARKAIAAIREVVANTTPPYKRRRL